jgi:tRNA dimethylallyltransferase
VGSALTSQFKTPLKKDPAGSRSGSGKSSESTRDPLLTVVLGPTASGKTALALSLARRFHGEIINCDSVAMYREFEVGTAKPGLAERAEITHHLLDCVDPLSDFSAGEYARRARQILKEFSSNQISEPGSVPQHSLENEIALPIVTGGTGLYLRALLEGLFPGPRRSEELRAKLRTRARNKGAHHLQRILQRLDRDAALQIHANDIPKMIRAIEVCLSSRQPMTKMWQQGSEPLRGFRILRLGLNPARELLYARINQRATKMFDDGLVDETRELLNRYGENARPLSALGYKQAMQLLNGQMDRQSAVTAAQQAHRNYAKRQLTWFRREPNVIWLEGFGDDPKIQAEAIAAVETQL